MIYPRYKSGVYIYGLPAVISFYKPPACAWTLDDKGQTESIAYHDDAQHQALYDISSIWIPRPWTDYYEWNERGLLSCINCLYPGSFRDVEYARRANVLRNEFWTP